LPAKKQWLVRIFLSISGRLFLNRGNIVPPLLHNYLKVIYIYMAHPLLLNNSLVSFYRTCRTFLCAVKTV
jgi:hypothetical protein